MLSTAACPNPDVLSSYLLGQLKAEAMDQLAKHIEDCPRCRARLEALRSPVDQTAVLPDKQDTTPGSAPPPPPFSGELSTLSFLAPAEAPDEIGRLGGYRVLKVLGTGGMGIVFLAEDVLLQRRVALKSMKPTVVSGQARERFFREARAAAAIEHEHIVPIYQVGEDRGVPYLAMQLLQGEALDERLKREPVLSTAEVLRIGREIAEGLAAAHERGLIHRDIKPANIWLEGEKVKAKLLDFGLARVAGDTSNLTHSGTIVGTPAYMAPEQARGEAVDARCDLFSLGAVLYQMSTGKQPFQGTDTMSTLIAVAMNEPEAPCTINEKLPPELSALVMNLLEKDADKRPGTAREVVQALQAIEKKPATRAGETTEMLRAVSPRPSPAGRRGTPRKRLVVGLLAIALLAILGGVVFYWLTNYGIVRIEINDPDIQVVIDKDGPTIQGVDKQEVKLSPGDHSLHIKRGDLKFVPDKFVLKRGETIDVSFLLGKGPLQVLVLRQGSGRSHQLFPSTGSPTATPGHYALRFGETDRVEMPSIEDHDGPLTFEAFATILQPNSTKKGYVIGIGPGASGRLSPGAVLLKVTSGSNWNLGIIGDKGVDRRGIKSDGQVGKRVHVACVRTDKELRLYVDGKLAGSEALLSKETKPARGKIMLGGGSFVGLLDELRVSKSARYDTDFTPASRLEKDADTLALYRFDEGSGDTLRDSDPNRHNGKITGAKWVQADGSEIPTPPSGRE